MVSIDSYEKWALIEVMGHSRYVGLVRSVAFGGSPFFEVTMFWVDGSVFQVKLFSPSSIFAITEITEDEAKCHARAIPKAEESRPSPMLPLEPLPLVGIPELYEPEDLSEDHFDDDSPGF